MNAEDMAIWLIEHLEGLRLRAYLDQVGVWTIGYGCTGPDIGPGLVWTEQECTDHLDRLVTSFISAVGAALHNPPSENELASLTSFAYNVGLHALLGSTLLKLENVGDKAGAAAQFARWDHAGGRVLSDLVKRREVEKAVYLGTPPEIAYNNVFKVG